MENKIKIAELLKDCTSGMELDCTMFEDVYFDHVDELDIIHCYIQHETYKTSITFNQHGQYIDADFAKCAIFPKGKTTWEGFVPPCKFKDGDIVAATVFPGCTWVGIFKQYIENKFESYCFISAEGVFKNIGLKNHSLQSTRLATEEEKQKLFQAIKDNGYHRNAETKTLEKLVEPKFKVGDKIEKLGYRFTIIHVKDNNYLTKCGNKIPIDNQDDFILVPNKFDITTLKPFDKVLIRDSDTQEWCASLFSHYNELKSYKYTCVNGTGFKQCIPYKSNEYLLGTTDDCNEFYKTLK